MRLLNIYLTFLLSISVANYATEADNEYAHEPTYDTKVLSFEDVNNTNLTFSSLKEIIINLSYCDGYIFFDSTLPDNTMLLKAGSNKKLKEELEFRISTIDGVKTFTINGLKSWQFDINNKPANPFIKLHLSLNLHSKLYFSLGKFAKWTIYNCPQSNFICDLGSAVEFINNEKLFPSRQKFNLDTLLETLDLDDDHKKMLVEIAEWLPKKFTDISDVEEIYEALYEKNKEKQSNFARLLNQIYQSIFISNDEYTFANDLIFIIKQFADSKIPQKCQVLFSIEDTFKSNRLKGDQDMSISLNNLSKFESIAIATIIGIILSDKDVHYDIDNVSDILKTCVELIQSRTSTWNLHLIIGTMTLFQKTDAGGHLNALKGAIKAIQAQNSLDFPLGDFVIVRLIQLCYYNHDSTEPEFQKKIAGLLDKRRELSPVDFNKYFAKAAKDIALAGTRFAYIQHRESLYNSGL